MGQRVFKIRTREELMSAIDPSFLVDQILPIGSLSVLVGTPGVGKTFTALSLSLSICNGLPWLGHEIHEGEVIYITSEGLNGLKLRMQAWELENNLEVKNFGYITEAPQFLNGQEIKTLIENIRASHLSKPVLIVIDTLARHMVGGDENSASHMGEFIASVDKLRSAFNCAVLIVHHTGKRKSNTSFSERGSSALRGAADSMLLMEKDKNGVFIRCEKQKDSEPFKPISVELKPIELPNDNNSCVLVGSETCSVSNDKLDTEKEKILGALLSANGAGLRTREILYFTGIPESSYHRHRSHLTEHGFITLGTQKRYFLTESGKEYALTLKTLPTSSHESHTVHSQHSHTPLGVGAERVGAIIENVVTHNSVNLK
jgi:hypothetical protein